MTGWNLSKIQDPIISKVSKSLVASEEWVKQTDYDFTKIPELIIDTVVKNIDFVYAICWARVFDEEKIHPKIIQRLALNPHLASNFATKKNYSVEKLPEIIKNSVASNPSASHEFARLRRFNIPEIPDEIINSIGGDPVQSFNFASAKITEWKAKKREERKEFVTEKEIPKVIINRIATNPENSLQIAKALDYDILKIPETLRYSIGGQASTSISFASEVKFNYAKLHPKMIDAIVKDVGTSGTFMQGVNYDKNRIDIRMVRTIVTAWNEHKDNQNYFKTFMKNNPSYDFSGYDEDLINNIIAGIARDPELCLGFAKSRNAISNKIPEPIMKTISESEFHSSQYAKLTGYIEAKIPPPVMNAICQNPSYAFTWAKDCGFNFDRIPQSIIRSISLDPQLLAKLKVKYAEHKAQKAAQKEMETKPEKIVPSPPPSPKQPSPLIREPKEEGLAKSRTKITKLSSVPTGFSEWLADRINKHPEPVNVDNVIEWVQEKNIPVNKLNELSLEGSIKEANMWKTKQIQKTSSVKITKIANDKKTPDAETLALCVLTLKVYLKDNENIPEEYKNLIEKLPAPRKIRQDFSVKECEVLYETVEFLWKKITGEAIIPEEKIQKAPEKMCGNYWILNGGILLRGLNHYDIIKKNSALICTLLGVGGMSLQEYLSGEPNKLIWWIIKNGGVRLFITKDGRFYSQVSPTTYGKWARKKIQKYDFKKKVVKVIDLNSDFNGWKSGISIIL